MILKKFIYLILIVTCSFFSAYSCSKSDSGGDPDPGEGPVLISLNPAEARPGESVNLITETNCFDCTAHAREMEVLSLGPQSVLIPFTDESGVEGGEFREVPVVVAPSCPDDLAGNMTLQLYAKSGDAESNNLPFTVVCSSGDDDDDDNDDNDDNDDDGANEIDNDGDGYCEDANGDLACDDGSRIGDCNDTDATIHPRAEDICGDGIDQDCKEGDAVCPGDDDDDDRELVVMPNLFSIGFDRNVSLWQVEGEDEVSVWTWGKELVDESAGGAPGELHLPTRVDGEFGNVINVAACLSHNIALRTDGTVIAWGNNIYGQLGNGSTDFSATPVIVNGLSNIQDISCGTNHNLALKSDGTVWAWGRNHYGQLGDGTIDNRHEPVQVLSGVMKISAGGYHSLALTGDKRVKAWGWNSYGQLGNGRTGVNSLIPIDVLGLNSVSSISAGTYHSLATAGRDSVVFGWGRNQRGQLCDGTTDDRNSPAEARNEDGTGPLNGATQISTGNYHSLILTSPTRLFGCGSNTYGQLGNGSRANSVTLPVLAWTGRRMIGFIDAGSSHSMMFTRDNEFWSWGDDRWGQLGNGNCTRCGSWVTPGRVRDFE